MKPSFMHIYETIEHRGKRALIEIHKYELRDKTDIEVQALMTERGRDAYRLIDKPLMRLL